MSGEFIKIYVPKEKMHFLKERKHQKSDSEWKKIFYYIKGKKLACFPDQIVNVLSSCGVYRKNSFYKINSMSNKDKIWDFYRILKDTPHDKLAVENSKFKEKNIDVYKIKDNPCLVSFQ